MYTKTNIVQNLLHDQINETLFPIKSILQNIYLPIICPFFCLITRKHDSALFIQKKNNQRQK